ncbi:hypothetical protein, partial [Neisseria sicca]|uniref:hypothetical protein n=1 Tax=Neisseria sicca TaxID=490 RepID=UPI001C996159
FVTFQTTSESRSKHINDHYTDRGIAITIKPTLTFFHLNIPFPQKIISPQPPSHFNSFSGFRAPHLPHNPFF